MDTESEHQTPPPQATGSLGSIDEEFQYARTSRRRFAAFKNRWQAGDITLEDEDERKRQRDKKQREDDERLEDERLNAGELQALRKAEQKANKRRHLKRYLHWLWPSRWRVLSVITLGMIFAATEACLPIITGWMINLIAADHGSDVPLFIEQVGTQKGFWLLALVGLVIIIGGRAIGLLRGYIRVTLTAVLTQRLRRQLYTRLIRLPLGELHDMKTGGIQSRLSGDVDSTASLVDQGVISPISALIRLLIVICLLLWIDWRVTIVAMSLLLIVGLIYQHSIRKMRPVWRLMRKQRGEIDGRLNEVFGGIRVVRSFAREMREQLDYSVGHHTVMRESIWAQFKLQLLFIFWDILPPLVGLAIMVMGGWYVMEGSLSIGEIVTMQLLSLQVLTPVLLIVRSVTETQRGLASMDRVYEILDKETEMPDRDHAIEAPTTIHDISFEHVSFAYDAERAQKRHKDPQWILRHIDFNIQGGSTVALVGASGAGKTTMINLLARFYDVSEGTMRINGIDVRDMRLQSWRSHLGFVQQDVFLFDGTLRDNIAYGSQQPSDEAVITAAKNANAWEFIEPLEKGLDTIVGERGVKLSGGQRQRIAIARAMLADPELLILDEATSNLDTESEQLIQHSLDRLLQGRTTFVIAHRLNTIRNADHIIVLEQGRIIESGQHEDLMSHKGKYFDMVERQTEHLAS